MSVIPAIMAGLQRGLGLLAGLRTSRQQHAGMMGRLLEAPMAFYDRTPQGRILNRFSSDVSSLDITVPALFLSVLTSVLSVLGSIVLIAVVTPWSLLAWVVLGALYGLVQVGNTCLTWVVLGTVYGLVQVGNTCLTWVVLGELYGLVQVGNTCLTWVVLGELYGLVQVGNTFLGSNMTFPAAEVL